VNSTRLWLSKYSENNRTSLLLHDLVSSVLHFLKTPPDASLERNRQPTKLCIFMKTIASSLVAYVLFDHITCLASPGPLRFLDVTYFIEDLRGI
jgi:hypothetical protein